MHLLLVAMSVLGLLAKFSVSQYLSVQFRSERTGLTGLPQQGSNPKSKLRRGGGRGALNFAPRMPEGVEGRLEEQ